MRDVKQTIYFQLSNRTNIKLLDNVCHPAQSTVWYSLRNEIMDVSAEAWWQVLATFREETPWYTMFTST